jgi:hypothetical protein
MVRPDRVETLEDVKAWIADHDGRIDAWWDAQHQQNRDNEHWKRKIQERLTALEKRVVWISGMAAGSGAGIGTVIVEVIKAKTGG